MSKKEQIPDYVKSAAKRAFMRTTLQAYAATIPSGGVSAAAIMTLSQDPQVSVIATSIIAALISPPLAGLAAWMKMLADGIPKEYVEAGIQIRAAEARE